MNFSKAHLTLLIIMFVFLVICIVINFLITKNTEGFVALFNEDNNLKTEEIIASNALSEIGAPIIKKAKKIIVNREGVECPNSCVIRSETVNQLANKGYLSEDKKEIILKNIFPEC